MTLVTLVKKTMYSRGSYYRMKHEPEHNKTYKMTCLPSEDLDQQLQYSLLRVITECSVGKASLGGHI